jgi:hypothetical protein
VSYRLERIKSDLSINIVEVSQPFDSFDASGSTVRIFGARSRLVLSGRSLNETRLGLSAGAAVFNNLVPASNLLERGFTNIDRWLETAAFLFDLFGQRSDAARPNPKNKAAAEPSVELADAGKPSSYSTVTISADKNGLYRNKGAKAAPLSAVLSALRSEIQGLAKAYGINRLPGDAASVVTAKLAPAALQAQLESRFIEDFVMLSCLARIIYQPMPILESLIELASVVTGTDLRKEGRDLADLGLVGMDASEIREHVSA